jgi:hypothetical protein
MPPFYGKTDFGLSISYEISVAEPHHFYAAPGKIFDAALAPAAPALAPTILYSKTKFLKRTKV